MQKNFNGILTLFLALFAQLTFAQNLNITGNVTDTDGLPVPGANIIVKGTTNGTQSDFDGNYSISANTGDVLVFSFIGFETKEVKIGASTIINVVMSEDLAQLDEVVVTALGIKRDKKALGYSQQSVQAEELQNGKQQDINNALAGKVAGVQIVGQSSSTFDNSSIKLRGETGVLYVVDGVQVYSISDINPANIEDMSVLKGASATAIYGPEGRNGVIIITTSRAKSGKASFTLDYTMTANTLAALPDYQNEYGGGYSQTFNTFTYDPSTDPASWASFDGDLYPDYWADESWGPKLDGQLVRHWDSWTEGTEHFGELRPWVKTKSDINDFYKTAYTNNTALSFAKAGEDYDIRSSIGLVDENGIIPNSNRKTINFAINSNFKVSEKFELSTVVNYQDRTTLNNPTQGYGNIGSNFNQWWQRQIEVDRLRDYEQNGEILSWNIRGPRDSRPLYWDSPYFHAYENLRHDAKNSAFGKIGGTYKFDEHFSVMGEIRSTFNSYTGDDRGTTKSSLDIPYYWEYQYRNTKEHYFGMANYTNEFADNLFDLNVSLGGEVVNNAYKYSESSTNGGLSIPNFYNLAGSIDAPSTSTTIRESETRGAFIKASLGFKDFLYVDGAYRYDWSSTASPEDNRVETFGVSASLLAHELFPKNDVITFTKLRAGYASAPYFPNPYQISQTYTPGDLYQGNGTLSVPNTQSNSELVGGTRTEFEAGAELMFAKNRIGLDITYFDRKDKDLPTGISLDGSTGYTGITVNSGKTSSKGIELALRGTIIQSQDFTWDLAVNYATLEKMVDEIYPGVQSYDISTYTSNMKLQARVGEDYGLYYGTGFAHHTDGSVIYTSSDKFAIQRNKKLGNLLPNYTGGISTTFRYKNLDLFLGFDGQKGGKYYSRTERYMDHSGLTDYTAGLNDKGNPKRDPVSEGGGVHIVGVLQTGTDDEGNPISDGTIVDKYVDAQDYFNSGNLGNIYENNLHDASYFKLRTIKLTYSFGESLVDKIGLTNAQLSFLANNVWLIYSDLPWIDPSELEKRDGVNWAEAGTLPMTSSYGVNLKLTF